MLQYILVITIIVAALVYAAIRLVAALKAAEKGDVCSGCQGCGLKDIRQRCLTMDDREKRMERKDEDKGVRKDKEKKHSKNLVD